MTTTKHAAMSKVEIAAIRARVAYGKLPLRKRLVTRRPPGWGTGRFGI